MLSHPQHSGIILFAIAIAMFCQSVAALASPQDSLLLTHANILDPEHKRVETGHLLIKQGRIHSVLTTVPEEFPGRVINLQGKWIIPGLNELHTHSFGNRAPGVKTHFLKTSGTAELIVQAGVTSLLDLFGDEQALFDARSAQWQGKAKGADILTSLSCLTATKGHCTEYGLKTRTMGTPQEAAAVVRDLSTRSPDVIKIVYAQNGRLPSIDKPTFRAAVEQAHALGLKTVVHIDSVTDIEHAVDVGADAITHLPSNQVISEKLAHTLAKSGTVVIPTLSVELDFLNFQTTPILLNTPMAKAMTTPSIREAYNKSANLHPHHYAHLQKVKGMHAVSMKRLREAGVTLLTGSDGGNYGTIQGYSVHREMMLFVEHGLSAWQALAAATTQAGTFLNKPFGVQPGDQASLVVLNASPLENIQHTQDIHLVIHHGDVIQAPWHRGHSPVSD